MLQSNSKFFFSFLLLFVFILLGQNCGSVIPNENDEASSSGVVLEGDGLPHEGKLTIQVKERIEPDEVEEVLVFGGRAPYKLTASNPGVEISQGSIPNQFFIRVPSSNVNGRFSLLAVDIEGRQGVREIVIIGKNQFMFDPSSLSLSEDGESLFASDPALGLIHHIDLEGNLIESIRADSKAFFPIKVTALPGDGLLSLVRNGSLFYKQTGTDAFINANTQELINYFYNDGRLILVASHENKIKIAVVLNFDFQKLDWTPVEVIADDLESMGIDKLGRFWTHSGGHDVLFYNQSGEVAEVRQLRDNIDSLFSGEPVKGELLGRASYPDHYNIISDPFANGGVIVHQVPLNLNEKVQVFFHVEGVGYFTIVQKNYNRFVRIYGSQEEKAPVEWSSGGSQAQAFAHPCDLELDKDDNIYLNDLSNDRVSKFNADLEYLFSIDQRFTIRRSTENLLTECHGDIHFLFDRYPLVAKGKIGQLANELSTGRDRRLLKDKIYCSNKFDSNCSPDETINIKRPFNQLKDLMNTFGLITTSSTAPDNSFAVVFGKFGGTMFVLERQQVSGVTNISMREYDLRDSLGIAISNRVIDSAVTSEGKILILTRQSFNSHRIHLLNQSGELISSFGPSRITHDLVETGLYIPRAMAIDHQTNRVLVTDAGDMVVKSYNISDGSYAGKIGGRGNSALTFRRPMGIAIKSNGDLVISDSGNNRIQLIPNFRPLFE